MQMGWSCGERVRAGVPRQTLPEHDLGRRRSQMISDARNDLCEKYVKRELYTVVHL